MLGNGISLNNDIGILVELRQRVDRDRETGWRNRYPNSTRIARQSPQPFLDRGNEAGQRASFADDGSHFGGGLASMRISVSGILARLTRLHHQHALQHAAIYKRNPQKRM